MSGKIVLGALAAALLSSHAAFAVSLNPRGIGEALIYPYYTINKNQDTLISVVNPTDVGKAIQVRFREGFNGRDALAFVLYLAPHDEWTASMSGQELEAPRVRTSDKSCTGSPFPDDGVSLTSAGYDGASPPYPADGGPTDITRTREGFVELIVGADVVAGSATAAAIAKSSSGAPSCAGLYPMHLGDLAAPTGGIYGSASIVDVGRGTFFAYNAEALQDFTGKQLFADSDPLGPTLADANSPESNLGGAVAWSYGFGKRPWGLDYAKGIDAVSAVLMADAAYGEYFVDAHFGAHTDWVVTFPTKSFYVDKLLYPSNPTPPFEEPFSAPGLSSVTVGGHICDREQNCQTIPLATSLSYQVNVVPIDTSAPEDPSGVFGSLINSTPIVPLGTTGNIAMSFTSSTQHKLSGGHDAVGANVALTGLPFVGFMAYDIINTNAQQGVLANYGGVFPLHATSACEGSAGSCH